MSAPLGQTDLIFMLGTQERPDVVFEQDERLNGVGGHRPRAFDHKSGKHRQNLFEKTS